MPPHRPLQRGMFGLGYFVERNERNLLERTCKVCVPQPRFGLRRKGRRVLEGLKRGMGNRTGH